MNRSFRRSNRWWIAVILVGILSSAVIVGSAGWYRHMSQKESATNLKTLHEALWVTERDFSRFYAPGSRESQSVVKALSAQDATLLERRFDGFVLYRRGLTDGDSPNELLLVLGIDPNAIPAAKKE